VSPPSKKIVISLSINGFPTSIALGTRLAPRISPTQSIWKRSKPQGS